jgi:hypothetical protein
MDSPSTERWLAPLAELAARRGVSDGVVRRAAAIARELRISPWIALGVAEGLVRMADAETLDRAARCHALQTAVLDRRMGLEALRHALPYAPFLLAADLTGHFGPERCGPRESLAIAEGLLAAERRTGASGAPAVVRTRPFDEYAAAVGRIADLRRSEGFDFETALQVATGAVELALARRGKQLRDASVAPSVPSAAAGSGPRRPRGPGGEAGPGHA